MLYNRGKDCSLYIFIRPPAALLAAWYPAITLQRGQLGNRGGHHPSNDLDAVVNPRRVSVEMNSRHPLCMDMVYGSAHSITPTHHHDVHVCQMSERSLIKK